MHEELVRLSNVWQADVAADRARARLAALAKGVEHATRVHHEAEAARRDARAERDALVADERANGRELDRWTITRDASRRMLADGTAPDWGAVERQLAAANAQVDALETRGLELLDAMERAARSIANTERLLVRAAEALEEVRRALATETPTLEAEAAEGRARRDEAWAVLPSHLRGAYEDHRRRRRAALVNTTEAGTCASCSMLVPRQRIVETHLGKALHTCPGCSGWLLP